MARYRAIRLAAVGAARYGADCAFAATPRREIRRRREVVVLQLINFREERERLPFSSWKWKVSSHEYKWLLQQNYYNENSLSLDT